MTVRANPLEPQSNWALFLDFDGTLIDIAPTPSAVTVPADLVSNLEAAARRLGGALAIVSGRPLEDVDRLLAPLRLPGCGDHGGVVRFPDGSLDVLDVSVPAAWVEKLERAIRAWPGVLIEIKARSVAVHYRLAPDAGQKVLQVAKDIVADDPGRFEVLPARMAVEIRPRAMTKARAVERLMESPPFSGRIPVFVGDDRTDEDGIRAAERRGGFGLRVAADFGGQPRVVRRWLARFAQTAGKERPHADA